MAVPYTVSLSISDAKGDISIVSIPLKSSTLLVDAVDAAEALIPIVQPLVNGALRAADISIPISFTPWAAAASTSDVQEKARFVFRTVGGWLKHLSLPSFIEGFFIPGTHEVDLTDTDVAAFVTAMTDGVTVPSTNTVEPSDTRDEDLTELEAAVEAWGNARR